MTKKELEAKGTKILETDTIQDGVWFGTNTLYLYDNKVYLHKYNCNLSQYTGKENIISCFGDRKSFFSWKQDFWKEDLVEGVEEILTPSEIESFRK